MLGFFKYTDFFLENFNLFNQILGLDFAIPLPHILLPLALSFVTFQQIAFLVDCYKGEIESSEIGLLDYCLFISFFPQLIAGPIVHHREMMPQFHAMGSESRGVINWEHIAKGLFIFSIGLFKKVFIADSFAKWANAGFRAAESGNVLNIFESWASSLSYTFQLYFDFSGYCDMAIGLGLLFGIMLPLNFNSPYKACNIADFWRRWHITLGRFLREYLYIPLGGNRNAGYQGSRFYGVVNKLLTLRNLFIVAFLSGVWHGAGWGFVIWGSLHGLAMVAHRIYLYGVGRVRAKGADSQSLDLHHKGLGALPPAHHTSKPPRKTSFLDSKLYTILCWFITFNFINITWVFFRAENVEGALNILRGMFGGAIVLPLALESRLSFLTSYNVSFGVLAEKLNAGTFELILWFVGAFIICLCCKNSIEITNTKDSKLSFYKPYVAVMVGVLFTFCIAMINKDSAFLYFNF